MDLDHLLRDQDGITTRKQLRSFGLTSDAIKAQIKACRWRALNEIVVCTHNGPLTAGQQRWAAVLSAQKTVALGGLTCMESFGVRGFETSSIHVLVGRGSRVVAVPGLEVVVHESRRFSQHDVLPRLPPVTGLERATIDAAAWSADVNEALRIVVAPIQQRRTSPSRLREALTEAGCVQHHRVLSPFITDLEGGAQALSEVAFVKWCRRHRFPIPTLQVRLDRQGLRRYLDATFTLPNGERVFAEIDGGIHLTLATRWLDTAKDNDAVIAREMALRFPSVAIYTDSPRAIQQLRDALQVCQR